MGSFLQQIVNGLSLGSIYALVALGYTMVYGIIKLINFAHGDIYMIGAYTAFFVTTYMGMSFIPALIVCMIVCGILGVLIERIAYKPLRKSPRITALITAIGVSYVIEYTTQFFMGVRTHLSAAAAKYLLAAWTCPYFLHSDGDLHRHDCFDGSADIHHSEDENRPRHACRFR